MIHIANRPSLPMAAKAAKAAQPTTTATSPKPKSTAVKREGSSNTTAPSPDMFSPTSAAAIALSSLHTLGSDRGSEGSRTNPPSALRGTRLFNNAKSSKGTAAASAPANTAGPSETAAPVAKGYPTPSPPGAAAAAAPAPYYAPHRHFSTGAEYGPQRSIAPWGAPPYPHHDNYYHPHHAAPSRGSSPNFMGPTPMMARSSSAPPAGGPHSAYDPSNRKTSLARLASANSMVTPTPKKPRWNTYSAEHKLPSYSRKKKSLGVLAENFLNTYKKFPRGAIIVVDEAAQDLGVERRRIYDVVNILESICLVCKKQKNTYEWMGMEQLDGVFGRLQAQAILEHPQDAALFLGATPDADLASKREEQLFRESRCKNQNKSLAKLSQEFLQVFLVGHETLSLPEASDKIQGKTSMEDLIALGSTNKYGEPVNAEDDKERKAAAARGLKTKIRRLYDIANVFLSVGLLEKVEQGSDTASRRPNFRWAYEQSPKSLYDRMTLIAEAKAENEDQPANETENSKESVVQEEVVVTIESDQEEKKEAN